MSSTTALRGRLLSFTRAPEGVGDGGSYTYIDDGLIVIDHGRIAAVGPAAEVALPAGTAVDHYPDRLILPGFIDAHIHFPQTQVIASYGAQLFEWLDKYTFVAEQKYADPAHAARQARGSSSTSCCATGRRRPWSMAASIRNRWTPSSPNRRRAASA